MNNQELEKILIELARGDLSEGSDIHDHPCMIALRVVQDLTDRLDTAERQIELMNKMMGNLE